MAALRPIASLCAILALVCAADASAAEPVRPADAFVDSIGVNVHMTYTNTPYLDYGRVADRLDEAGIRHVREGLSRQERSFGAYDALADRGVGITFIMGEPRERADTLEQLLTVLRTRVGRSAEAVEGPNEYSYSGDPQWSPHLRAYQERLYAGIKGDPSLAHLPVVAPSLIAWQDYAEIGDLRNALDVGNKHIYAGGDLPEANVDWELSVAARMSGERPVWVTESGYHNGLASANGHRPASEAATATYLPRMYLEHFRHGIPRTFAYELVDEWPDPALENHEAHFGMLRHDYSEKPSFRRVANLIAVLADPGPPHPTAPLDLGVRDAPADLRRLVLQKRDGSYYIVLWRAARVWDPVARTPLVADSLPVSLRVGGEFDRAELIDPARSTQAFESREPAGELRLSVGPDPLIVRLLPAAASLGAPQAAPVTDQPAAAPVEVSPTRLTIPRRKLKRVIRRGLLVKCRAAERHTCAVSAEAGRDLVARGGGPLDASGSGRVRLRPTRAGARLLRRFAAQKRAVKLRLQATARA